MRRLVIGVVTIGIALTGCAGSSDDAEPLASTATTDTAVEPDPGGDRFPEIVDVEATRDDSTNTWTFAVTVSSPYDTPERYADGWRVLGPDGAVFGVHELAHDHAGEQPFTRTQTGVVVPDDVQEVTVEGRDLVNGFGGATLTVDLDAGDP